MVAKVTTIFSKTSTGGYFAYCPDLDLCHTEGRTYEEAQELLRELIEYALREKMEKDDIWDDDFLPEDVNIVSEMYVEVEGERRKTPEFTYEQTHCPEDDEDWDDSPSENANNI